MGEATERFFASMPARAPAVLHGPVSGSLRVDLAEGNRTEHWRVEFAPGSAEVRREGGPADATWSGSAELFERLAAGDTQMMAAVFRNEATISGSVVLFLAFRRFFPDPPGTRDPREAAREQAGRSG